MTAALEPVSRTIAPDFRVISIDESRYVDKDFLAKTGLVRGVYLYDKNEVTHLCSLTPSYTLYPLYASWERASDDYYAAHEDERDAIEDVMMREFDEGVKYFDVPVLDAMERELQGSPSRYHVLGNYYGASVPMTEEEYDEARERVEDHCKGNHYVW